MKSSSKVVKFPLASGKVADVTMTKKRMKNIRLSISSAGKINISMPHYTSYAYAYEFLVRKRDWINTQLTKSYNLKVDNCNFCDNGNIFLLGNNYPLTLQLSTKNKVAFDNAFTILTKDLSEEYVKFVFLKWCKKYFLDFFTNRLNFIYNQMFKTSFPPNVKIKTMKSMWGNCNYVKRIITLNLYLAKARIECIDYVITHELCHLIHHNHGKEFHNLMTTLLPDWKVRKKMLKSYSLNF
ncbi:MAG: M48 family metallopeptidase [Clostridia bacterium]|nr:M48 family metallopeptidase [Clostridia bacterium]